MNAFDKNLRHIDHLRPHPLFELLLCLSRHEHVLVIEFDQMGPQDLFDLEAAVVGAADYTHGGGVDDYLARFLLLPSL